ncbi:MAG TPA: PDDEXK nuclease domain-containing protein [Bacteroidales bacterium]|nr:PDDEXK nuclease domain-containing protein [Bacteroidales bacterium]HPS15716.1 PDDEXK nuclease domain-containing protein [Bacteroidales bacterium]
MLQKQFYEIIEIIKKARYNALKTVNIELINLYWQVGEYISKRLKSATWGDKTVNELASFIQNNHPELKGFNRRGLYRMKQFYETYVSSSFVTSVWTQLQLTENQNMEIVSALGTQLELSDIRNSILVKLSWTHHRIIFSRCKSSEEIEFYVKMSVKESYTARELDRQISAGFFERTMIGNQKNTPELKEKYPDALNIFKDNYIFEFLNLPEDHNENELQKALITQMKNFILELGKDFLFISEEYRVQVGNSDYYIDLLFYNRNLQCLVAVELKTEKFKPEYLGKLNFYLEALDRDVKKMNENPSIGILLCKDKDMEVVEYALSRSLSPTMISEYKIQLPDKKLLQQKLHQLFLYYE